MIVNNNTDVLKKSSPPENSTSVLFQDAKVELERTPGGAAVSRGMRGGVGGGNALPDTPSTNSPGGGGEGADQAYKDSVANPATSRKSTCGTWAIVTECSSGKHHFAKKIYCGKEYCEVCGEDDSASHKRRQARLLPKFQEISQLGYFVIEFPDWARHIGKRGTDPDLDGDDFIAGWCYSKADLVDTTNRIIEVMAGKRMGRRGRVGGYFSRGVGRWHFFGEKVPGKFNPHFNILVDGCHLEPQLLEKIKAALRSALNVPDLIVHYSYFDTPGQIVQKVRYLTRATFKNYDWSPYMANELFNFRNIRWWGNWEGEKIWELKQAEAEGENVGGLQAVSKLFEDRCPDCGEALKVLYHNKVRVKVDGKWKYELKPVHWSRPVDSTYLDLWQAKEISGTGYYRIPEREWQGYSFSPGEFLRLEAIEAAAKQKPTVSHVVVRARKRAERKLRARQDDELRWATILEECHEREANSEFF